MGDINLKLESKGIDLESIIQEQEDLLKEEIKNLALVTYDDIVQQAQENLEDSRQDFIKSLEFEDLGNLYVISIKEPGIHYEEGWSSFDQKPGLLSGPNAKTSKKGTRYNIVPFRHKKADPKRSRKHPTYPKMLNETISKMEAITPREIRDRSGRVVGRVVAKARNEKEGLTAGMIKVEKQYKKKKDFTYLTFRVVSDNSDPSKWKHPGFKGLKAFDRAEELLDRRIDDIIEVIFGG